MTHGPFCLLSTVVWCFVILILEVLSVVLFNAWKWSSNDDSDGGMKEVKKIT